MASNRVLAKSINMPFLQSNNKFIYVSLLVVLSFFLLLDYVPGMHAYSAWVTPPLALFLGLAFALLCGQAHPKFNKKTSKYLLQYSVVGLGFGMNLQASLASGKQGMEFTIISVVGTLLIGWLIGRKFLKVDRDTSYLISSGTAICGGSAIAAVGPVLKAKDSEMSVALGTIFILNAIALFVFPMIGHALNMSQHEFGTWAAIAIHDTSSVVGAGAAYGEAYHRKNKQCNGIQYKNGAQCHRHLAILCLQHRPHSRNGTASADSRTGTDKIGSVTVHFQELTSYEPAYEQCPHYRNNRELHSLLARSQGSLQIHSKS
jgi:hypothetical protein